MPQVYEVEKDGKICEVEAPSPQAAAQALERRGPTPPPDLRPLPREILMGAVKGAGRTAVNLGQLVHRVPGVSEAVDWLYGSPPGLSSQAFRETATALEPTSTGQRVGGAIESLAEFAVPGGMVARTMRGARVVPRMLAEGATMAGVTAAQTRGDR